LKPELLTFSETNRKIYLNENIVINIKYTEKQDLKELIKIKNIITNLFSILLNSSANFDVISIMSDSNSWYKSLLVKENIKNSFVKSVRPINYKYFEENSQQIFENWFHIQNELELLIKGFFSVCYRIGVLPENRLITYISILENYFKNRIEKKKENVKEIVNNYYDDTEKESVKNITNLTNVLIYFIHNSSISKNTSDIKEYAKKLKITRNYYAHLEEKHKKQSFTIEQIVNENLRLEYMIIELLYREMDITIPEYKYQNLSVIIEEE